MTLETDAAVIASNGQWSNVLKETCQRLERERDEAREAFIEARKHREQLNSLLQSYEACWDEIKTTLGEPEEGDQTCDLDRVLKAIRERDEARNVASELALQAERLRKQRDEARKEAEYYKERYEQLKDQYGR